MIRLLPTRATARARHTSLDPASPGGPAHGKRHLAMHQHLQRQSPRRRHLAAVVLALVAAGLTMVPTTEARADSAPADPANPATPTTVTADALPTVQINGVVWSQAVVGNVVYVGGDFSSARPAGAAPGVNETPRQHLLAYDVTTGELISSFAPQLNGQVRAVTTSPDKSRLYVGGTFTTVNGQTRNRVAAFDIATGQLVADFKTFVNYDVYALVATAGKVFVGGDFQSVGTQARGYLAAFTTSGQLLDWAPKTNAPVWAMALSPDASKIAVGGSFTTTNGSSNPGNSLALLDTTTGASLPMAVNNVVRNGGVDSAITSLTADGNTFFGSGYSFGNRDALEGVFAASFDGGATTWIGDCHGDAYSVYPRAGALYAAGHSHYCGNIDGFPESSPTRTWQRAVAFSTAATRTVTREPLGYANYQGQPGPELLTWFPRMNAGTFTGLAQGPWSVAGNDDYVVYGGEFTLVNNRPQQGLVRFATRAIAPKSQGPTLFGATFPLNLSSTGAGRVRINWGTNQDLDNETLTYRVYRDVLTKAGLVYAKDAAADYWAPYTMGFTDTGLDPGSTHQYRVSVTDPDGNIAYTLWTSVTVAASGAESPYVRAVYDSQPTKYWRFSETSGTTVADKAGFDAARTSSSGVTRGATGAIAGDTDRAATFNGSSGSAWSSTLVSPPSEFSIEAWFRTNSANGKIVGFGDKQSGLSATHDRHLYIDKNGRLNFGVHNGTAQVATSSSTYTDNRWHQAVATLSASGGMKLYVDGALVAQRADVTFARSGYWGYWRLGYDQLSGWPNKPNSNYFRGDLDEVSIYHRALNAAEVQRHRAAGIGANVAPIADFGAVATSLTGAFDASGSRDLDGTVASYAWSFGDGSTGTGVTTTHAYAASGTYQVTLTVTDNQGATTTATRPVTVERTNTAPTASFTTAIDNLQVGVDGRESADPDGSLVSYAWTFGDGSTATGPQATHQYALAGTYTVGLTVTDDRGATASTTRQVSVSPANVLPTASFTSATSDLAVAFDGRASNDPDGSIASYAWTFGDGSTGTGAQPSHGYGAVGTYPVTLVVTDDRGGTATSSADVVVSVAAPFAHDAFGRTVVNGWGAADAGGDWVRVGLASNFSVAPGAATIRLPAAKAGPRTTLSAVSSSDTEVRVQFGVDKAATGAGVNSNVEARVNAAGDAYSSSIRLLADGRVTLLLMRRVAGAETVLQSVTVPGLSPAPGDRLNVRMQAVGTGSTQLRAKVWAAGSAEPGAWQVTATDTAAALQAAGTVGLGSYLTATATNAPVQVSYSDFWAGTSR